MSPLTPYLEAAAIVGLEPMFKRAWQTTDRYNNRVLLFNTPMEDMQQAMGAVWRRKDGQWQWEVRYFQYMFGVEPNRHLAMLACEQAALHIEAWERKRHERTRATPA